MLILTRGKTSAPLVTVQSPLNEHVSLSAFAHPLHFEDPNFANVVQTLCDMWFAWVMACIPQLWASKLYHNVFYYYCFIIYCHFLSFIVFVLISYSTDSIPFSQLRQVWGYRRSRGPACKHITKVVLPTFKPWAIRWSSTKYSSSLRLWCRFKPAVVSHFALISLAGNNNPHNFPKGPHTCGLALLLHRFPVPISLSLRFDESLSLRKVLPETCFCGSAFCDARNRGSLYWPSQDNDGKQRWATWLKVLPISCRMRPQCAHKAN